MSPKDRRKKFRGRSVLVTGASSGIGRQLALDFAEEGADLFLVARRRALLEEVAEICRSRGVRAGVFAADLAEREAASEAVRRTVEAFGRLDILVNNAGMPKHKQIYDVTFDDVARTMAVNFLAPAYLTIAAIPVMLRQREGFIVNISSGAGKIPPPRETVYAASKFALTGFTEGLWLDLEGSNIHPAVVHVGPIDTEIWEKAAEEAPVRYRGKKYPPRIVSEAVFACIEKRRYEATVPPSLRWVFLLKELFPALFRRGARRWDPVPRSVVESARSRTEAAP
ncbi:MAG: oxidoreductase [Candidatus Binatia bacterium]|nr:MAG: oxidoreductase [Candidatus Binatia bacterium]